MNSRERVQRAIHFQGVDHMAYSTPEKIAAASYREPARDIPLLPAVDVVVCGGGPAGVGAALAAARNGSRTMIVDIHEPEPGSRSRLADRRLPPGKSYGVPFRCLVPQNVEQILVAGRCLSATHAALASVRMMPSCMAMGQAAGTAAALCARNGTSVRNTDVQALRDMLRKQGVEL